MTTKAAATYLGELDIALAAIENRERAQAMAAYMKNQFPFLGIATPARRAVVKALPKPSQDDLPVIARKLWRRKEREYQYVAIDLLADTAHFIYAKVIPAAPRGGALLN